MQQRATAKIDAGASDPALYGASWYTASKVAAPARPPLTTEVDADVCIIGGGLAGLTAAREIARRDWRVILLEARRIAWSASGRNTGFVMPGFASDARTLLARAGRQPARSLWALSQAGAEYVRNAIRDYAIEGAELSENGWLHVSKDDNNFDVQSNAELLQREFGADVEFWPSERVREQLKSPLYFSGIQFKRAFTIHPLNYALGLAKVAEAAGARIFEDSPVVEIDPAGVRKRVVTPTARVRATHVVLAGNVHLGGLMPRISRTLFPASSYVLTTGPLGPKLAEAIGYPGAVSDTDLADNHYRVVGGDRLMWSGRSTMWRGDPRRYVGALLADLARAYPQLPGVTAEYVWTGMLGNTVHRMPQIGEVSPGLWLLSGFGGQGLNTTAMGGEMIARAIVEDDQSWHLFAPFELVWAGGVLGRATLQAYYWSYRARERLASTLARRRESQRRRIEEEARAVAAAMFDPPEPVVLPAMTVPAVEMVAAPVAMAAVSVVETAPAAELAAAPEAQASAPAEPIVAIAEPAMPSGAVSTLPEASPPEPPPTAIAGAAPSPVDGAPAAEATAPPATATFEAATPPPVGTASPVAPEAAPICDTAPSGEAEAKSEEAPTEAPNDASQPPSGELPPPVEPVSPAEFAPAVAAEPAPAQAADTPPADTAKDAVRKMRRRLFGRRFE